MAKKEAKKDRMVSMTVSAKDAFGIMFDRHLRDAKTMEARSHLEHEKLNSFERDLLFGSVRYYCGRSSICALMFPQELVRNWWFRISDEDKMLLHRDLEDSLRMIRIHSEGKRETFDAMSKDRPDEDIWQKFMHCLNKDEWRECRSAETGEEFKAFLYNGKYYEVWFFLANMSSAAGVPEDEFHEEEGILIYDGKVKES